MNLVLLTKRKGQLVNFELAQRRLLLPALLGILTIPALLLYGGYHWGAQSAESRQDPVVAELKSELELQRRHVAEAVERSKQDLDALSLQLGKMQARVIRLDALGRRLTKMAELDQGEFDFENPPAQGGPQGSTSVESPKVPDFLATLKELSHQLEDRERQLQVLETMLMNRNLQAEAFPTGRPIKKGWISSYYGMRTDPFTGKRERHEGIDFAGRLGSDVMAVAAGVVTWAGERYGYGRLVEVNHGNGYVTRYAHNRKVLVKVGERVEKNQVLAEMGSSGRSTGPHVHFEVIHNGRVVNPAKYIRASR